VVSEPSLSDRSGDPPGRALALDLGDRRVGVALSDSRRVLATPFGVLARSGDRVRDHRAIATMVEETGAVVLVVGLPISLSGTLGPAAHKVTAEVEELRRVVGVPVVLVDERFSTVEATRRRREGTGRAPRGAPTRKRPVVDDAAATVFLQSWIDSVATESTA
jgi:putative Holliday junction resolvase